MTTPDPSEPVRAHTAIEVAILEYINKHPGANYREIATALDKQEFAIVAVCAALKGAGLIEGMATSGYKLTKEG